MKVVGKTRTIWCILIFLRYSSSESSMNSGFFFWRPFVKILIFRFTISLLMCSIHVTSFRKIPGNFPNLRGIFRNFLKISQNFPNPFTHYHQYPPPTLPTPNHPSPSIHLLPLLPHSIIFKPSFLQSTKCIKLDVFYLPPSCVWLFYTEIFFWMISR